MNRKTSVGVFSRPLNRYTTPHSTSGTINPLNRMAAPTETVRNALLEGLTPLLNIEEPNGRLLLFLDLVEGYSDAVLIDVVADL